MIDLDHNFAKRSNWIIILGNDRFGSFLTKFPQGMIKIDHFRKKWSKSIFFQKNDPIRSFCEIMFQIEKHLRKWSIWIIVAFGSLIDLEHFPKNDPNPEMIQNRQWSKSDNDPNRCQSSQVLCSVFLCLKNPVKWPV